MPEFTHFDDQGRTHMVEVGEKAVTNRTAKASGIVQMDAKNVTADSRNVVFKG